MSKALASSSLLSGDVDNGRGELLSRSPGVIVEAAAECLPGDNVHTRVSYRKYHKGGGGQNAT